MAMETLFSRFFFILWHPLLKVLLPGQTYVTCPKLYACLTFFNLVTAAWSTLREEILPEIERESASDLGKQTPIQICVSVFERTLPVV